MDVFSRQDPWSAFEAEEELRVQPHKATHRCRDRATQKAFVLETFALAALPPRIARKIEEEIQRHSQTAVEGLAAVRRAFAFDAEGGARIAVASKFDSGKPLKTIVAVKKYFPRESEPFEQMRQSAAVVAALHSRGGVHGDISLRSVFFKKSQSRTTLGRAQLRQIDKWTQRPPFAAGSLPCPPELARGLTAQAPADVWQLGAVFLQMALGEDLEERCGNAREAVAAEAARVTHPHLRDLLRRMLHQHPTQRPTMQQVIQLL